MTNVVATQTWFWCIPPSSPRAQIAGPQWDGTRRCESAGPAAAGDSDGVDREVPSNSLRSIRRCLWQISSLHWSSSEWPC